MQKKEWFEEWFDTEYYHILYKNRDDSEAQTFIKNLHKELDFSPNLEILDLACVKGRHTKFLNELGLNASGCDLSQNSISTALADTKNEIDFFVHDMRDELPKTYDVVLNLFTSFGYFEDLNDNLKVFNSVKNKLNTGGAFLIDFMNAEKVINNLVKKETKVIDGIEFHISREYNGSHIIKSIDFKDKCRDYHFEEKVQAVKFEDFKSLADDSGFNIINTYGDYELNSFEKEHSNRLILVLQHG